MAGFEDQAQKVQHMQEIDPSQIPGLQELLGGGRQRQPEHWADQLKNGLGDTAMQKALGEVLDTCKKEKLDPAGCMTKSEPKLQQMTRDADKALDAEMAKVANGNDPSMREAVRNAMDAQLMMKTVMDRVGQDSPEKAKRAGQLMGMHMNPETGAKLKEGIEDELNKMGVLDPFKMAMEATNDPNFKRYLEERGKVQGAAQDMIGAHSIYGGLLQMTGRFGDSGKQREAVQGYGEKLQKLE
jgi:hypothetical protein